MLRVTSGHTLVFCGVQGVLTSGVLRMRLCVCVCVCVVVCRLCVVCIRARGQQEQERGVARAAVERNKMLEHASRDG